MKTKAIVLAVYTLLMLIGGLMGFIKAGSVMSLTMSLAITALLSWSGYRLWTNHPTAQRINIAALSTILFIFIVRFGLTLKTVPAVLACLTGAMLLYLIYGPSNDLQSNQSSKHSEN